VAVTEPAAVIMVVSKAKKAKMAKKAVKKAKGQAATQAKVQKAPKEQPVPKTEDDESDGDDEEAEEEEIANDTAEEAQTPRKTKAHRFEQNQEDESEPKEAKGVVYLGHIPHGFFEPQMYKYFTQFGKVTRMRLSRSKKTGGSKGYAFIEFAQESVAKIVAQTMNKYLLFEKTLVCEFVPKEKRHAKLFKGCRTVVQDKRSLRREKEMRSRNDRPSVEVNGKSVPQLTSLQVKRRRSGDKKLKALLEQLEVDYDVNAVLSGAADDDEEAPAAKGKKRRKGGKASPHMSPATAAASEAPSAPPRNAKKKLKKKAGR